MSDWLDPLRPFFPSIRPAKPAGGEVRRMRMRVNREVRGWVYAPADQLVFNLPASVVRTYDSGDGSIPDKKPERSVAVACLPSSQVVSTALA